MDLPIGALGDGFEDRLVLESRGNPDRWVGCLLYLLVLPFALGATAFMVLVCWGLLESCVGFCWYTDLTGWLVFAIFGLIVHFLFQDYQARNFQEVALQGERLEVVQSGPTTQHNVADLLDAKSFPYYLQLRLPTGQRLVLYGLSLERKLQVLERVLPAVAEARRKLVQSGHEIALMQTWRPAAGRLMRAVVLGAVLLFVLGRVHPLLGLGVGSLVGGLLCWPLRQQIRGGGMLLSQTGLRRPGQPVNQEVPWSEVENCLTSSYFQDTLVVSTRKGDFRLLSDSNPVVWALVIRDLKG